MADAHFDNNHVPTMTAVLNTAGTSIINIVADGTTHGLFVNDGVSGSDNGPSQAMFDNNHVPTLMAVSSADGITPVALYADSSGSLLVKNT